MPFVAQCADHLRNRLDRQVAPFYGGQNIAIKRLHRRADLTQVPQRARDFEYTVGTRLVPLTADMAGIAGGLVAFPQPRSDQPVPVEDREVGVGDKEVAGPGAVPPEVIDLGENALVAEARQLAGTDAPGAKSAAIGAGPVGFEDRDERFLEKLVEHMVEIRRRNLVQVTNDVERLAHANCIAATQIVHEDTGHGVPAEPPDISFEFEISLNQLQKSAFPLIDDIGVAIGRRGKKCPPMGLIGVGAGEIRPPPTVRDMRDACRLAI